MDFRDLIDLDLDDLEDAPTEIIEFVPSELPQDVEDDLDDPELTLEQGAYLMKLRRIHWAFQHGNRVPVSSDEEFDPLSWDRLDEQTEEQASA